jgi:hypothetical protein
MRVLLFSTVVYLAGIAVALFFRPTLMFDRDGKWKEFGLHREDTTIFPFWLFCITWAFVSYFIGRVSLPDTPTDLVQSASAAVSLTTAVSGLRGKLVEPMEEVEEVVPTSKNLVKPLPVSGPATGGGRRRAAATSAKRLPKGYYLYVGGDESEEEGAGEVTA